MSKTKNKILKVGIMFMVIAALILGMAIPAMAASPTNTAAFAVRTVQGTVSAISTSSLTVQNGNQTPVIITVDSNTKYYQMSMGKAQSYVNTTVAQDNRQAQKGGKTQPPKANDLKNAHIPANWRDNLGWLETFETSTQFSDIQVGDRVIARTTNDSVNLAKQILLVKAPVIQQVKGTISAVSANSLTVTPANGTAVTLNIDAKTRVTLTGLILVQNGQYAIVTYNRTTLVAQLVNVRASAPTSPTTTATLTSIAITPASPADLPMGSTRQLTATATYSNNTTSNITSSVVWTSSNPAVATISSSGLVSAVNLGSTQVTATLSGITTAVTLNVVVKTLSSINITPANPSVLVGANVNFMATGTYSDGTTADLSATVVWSSSVPAVAVNPAAGVTTAAAVGATVITAVSGTVSKTTNLTVSAPVLTSIAVTPASVSVVLGANQQYVATGTYSNGSTADLSSQVTWTATSVTGSATVLTNGLAKGTAVGTVSITAAKLGFTIPAVSLTVIP